MRPAGQGFDNWMETRSRHYNQLFSFRCDRIGEGIVAGRAIKGIDNRGIHLVSSLTVPLKRAIRSFGKY